MNVANFLHVLDDGALVIVPGDRADVMVACLASSFSPEFPVPSALILTGGLAPDPNIYSLLAQAPFPVFAAPDDTYTTRQAGLRGPQRDLVRAPPQGGLRPGAVGQARGRGRAGGAAAPAAAGTDDAAAVPARPHRAGPAAAPAHRAARRGTTCGSCAPRKSCTAGTSATSRCWATSPTVRELAVHPGHRPLRHRPSWTRPPRSCASSSPQKYAELRAHKGVDLARALEVMLDGSYFGTMMVQLGVVDGMVSGAAHTTAHTIRPALEFVKTRAGVKIVSSVFLMLMPDRVLVYGDCAVNPDPNAEQLADIALASAETAAQFGVEPRVAMLSYSTGGSGAGEAVDKVRQATELVRDRRPDLAVEGPIQYDAAVDAAIAESKMPGSSVAGQATVFIFPDLNTGNNTYKAVQQSSGAVAVGPVLQGLRKPVNDLSRGCTVEDIVNTVAITAIQAQSAEPATEPEPAAARA